MAERGPAAGRRIVVGVSGASGSILAVRLLEELRRQRDLEVHLVASPAGLRTLQLEVPALAVEEFKALAHRVHDHRDIAAPLASGTFRHDGMIIVPCSMNTVAALAHGLAGNLLTRAADVTLKERRTLVVVPRETPLHLGHLRSLATLSELGAVILPPMPAFYQLPRTLEELVDHLVGRMLEQLGLEQGLYRPWGEGGGALAGDRAD